MLPHKPICIRIAVPRSFGSLSWVAAHTPNLAAHPSQSLECKSGRPVLRPTEAPGRIEQARLDLIKTDLDVCLTFAKVAETALSMGHREHAAQTIASAEKGYSDMLRYFSQATGMTPEIESELQSKFKRLRERLDGLHLRTHQSR